MVSRWFTFQRGKFSLQVKIMKLKYSSFKHWSYPYLKYKPPLKDFHFTKTYMDLVYIVFKMHSQSNYPKIRGEGFPVYNL